MIVDTSGLADPSLIQQDELMSKKVQLTAQISDPMAVLNVLVEWVNASETMPSCEGEVLDTAKPLPTYAVTRTRPLIIYVWGRKKRKNLPHVVDHNFNAAVLHGRKQGTNWRKDGRTQEIRDAVRKCPNFNAFLMVMLENIESKDMHTIGINCRAGRHRSVTLAIILRLHYYPDAVIHLLEIK